MSFDGLGIGEKIKWREVKDDVDVRWVLYYECIQIACKQDWCLGYGWKITIHKMANISNMHG